MITDEGPGAARPPDEASSLREDVREFLSRELASGSYVPHCDAWMSASDASFSRRLAANGWLGMTFPAQYGGHGRSQAERFVVAEELLAAGAPVAAHWFADRQMGPSILKFGSEEQKCSLLPAIARGEMFFCIGMSEPDSGSDLASIRTSASRTSTGWTLNGSKVWTTGAHFAHCIMALVRTSPVSSRRHDGLSQFIVPLSADGVQVRPITSMDGERHFNEVFFNDVALPNSALLGEEGAGWKQVTTELAFERSGPERLLSTLPLLLAWLSVLRCAQPANDEAVRAMGRLVARLWVLRQTSLSVASALAQNQTPDIDAAIVKDLGTQFEREVVEVVRAHARVEPDLGATQPLQRLLAEAILHAPGFTLRGGTTEILRGIVARDLGLR